MQTLITPTGNVKLFKKDKEGNPIHQYRNDLYPFMEYHSVTTVKKSIVTPFDKERMAHHCSTNPKHNLYGIEPHEIVKLWEENAQQSAMYGTRIHQVVEDFINEPEWTWYGNTPEQKQVIDQFITNLSELETEEYLLQPQYFKSEVVHHMPIRSSTKINDKYITSVTIDRMSPQETYLQLFSNDTTTKAIPKKLLQTINVNKTNDVKELLKKYILNIGVAGSVDVKWYNKDFSKYIIIDLKTDKEITTKSYNGKKKLLKPVNDLQDCKINEYGLQIYMYGIIGNQMENAQFDKGYIFHWNRFSKTINTFNLKDYTKYAKLTLAHYFNIL